jgi:glycosyltransferase involved in cell wall biosynthesis
MSVYNGEKYLREAIDSILNQTFKDFEFLIIDDGSTDSSAEIIRSYTDSRIRLIQNEKNIGLTRSLNKGLKLAQGEYIARMDADDISLPERLKKQVKYLDNHPEIGVLGTRFFEIDMNGNVRREICIPLDKRNIEKQLYRVNCFCHSSTMMRMSCIKKVGLYDETLKYAQDYELWLRMIDVCEVQNHPELLHKWRYNTRTGISVKKSSKQNKNAEEIRKKHIKRKLEADLIDYKYLTQLVRANPNDKLIASFFFREHEKSKNHDFAERLTYFQLKYLNENKKWNRAKVLQYLLKSLINNPLNFGAWSFIARRIARKVKKLGILICMVGRKF